jgi:Co/Zn/Cd efflux system component
LPWPLAPSLLADSIDLLEDTAINVLILVALG